MAKRKSVPLERRNEHGELLDDWGNSAEYPVADQVVALRDKIDELEGEADRHDDIVRDLKHEISELESDAPEGHERAYLLSVLQPLQNVERDPYKIRALDKAIDFVEG